MLYRPGTANSRGWKLWDERRFPDELASQIHQKPRLWANVLRLAVDELLAKKRAADAWELLAMCCLPYLDKDEQTPGALLALQVTLEAGLFQVARPWGVQQPYETLCRAARKALEDHNTKDRTGLSPQQRDIAGKLLGSDPFPGHDPRKGVGVRKKDGLPDIAWVEVPKFQRESGEGGWIYQDGHAGPLERFWIAKYPITYAQFEAFLLASDGFRDPRWWEGLAASREHRSQWGDQAFKHWNHPRERVSWYDAMAFCRWLTAKAAERRDMLPDWPGGGDAWTITLPTEQQWEKAARGHDGRQYPWGDTYEEGRANIGETWRQAGPHYLQKTSAVGMYPHAGPDEKNRTGDSPYGVTDLSGNVWEWCLNEWASGKTDPGGDAPRVLRGGSWDSLHGFAASAVRLDDAPDVRGSGLGLGFRVVAAVLPP
jgi:formylglycine-generating enzyme required for sulfatase activity